MRTSYIELDEYVNKYGYNNETDIEDVTIAMNVNARRKDKELCQQYMR